MVTILSTILLCTCSLAAFALEERSIYIRMTPLIGGPENLRLHSALLIEYEKEFIGFDFLPHEAQSPATLVKLLTLQSSPGYIRERRIPRGDFDCMIGKTTMSIKELRQAALKSRDTDLHLLRNQCWQHTLELAELATGRTLLDIARDVGVFLLASTTTWPPNENKQPPRDLHDEEDLESGSDATVSRAFAEEKARRFGRPLLDILSDSYREQLETSALDFEFELRRAEAEARAAKAEAKAVKEETAGSRTGGPTAKSQSVTEEEEEER